jgi:hypothetical protein
MEQQKRYLTMKSTQNEITLCKPMLPLLPPTPPAESPGDVKAYLLVWSNDDEDPDQELFFEEHTQSPANPLPNVGDQWMGWTLMAVGVWRDEYEILIRANS